MNDYEQPPQRKQRSKKKDITLMTLLAFDEDSYKKAIELLKKHGIVGAKNHEDLEQKLNQLYMSTNDKAGLEKELAEIHPHKNWLFRTLPEMKVVVPDTPADGAGTATTKIEDIKQDHMSSADGNSQMNKCNCSNCSGPYSSFDASGTVKQIVNDPMHLIALIAVIGLTYYFIKK